MWFDIYLNLILDFLLLTRLPRRLAHARPDPRVTPHNTDTTSHWHIAEHTVSVVVRVAAPRPGPTSLAVATIAIAAVVRVGVATDVEET